MASNKYSGGRKGREEEPRMSREKKLQQRHRFSPLRRLSWSLQGHGLVLIALVFTSLQLIFLSVADIFHINPAFPSSSLSKEASSQRQQRRLSRPWVGAGTRPAVSEQNHVRVVIRVHHLQEESTKSLIWSMRAQAASCRRSPPSLPSGTKVLTNSCLLFNSTKYFPPFSVDILLVPTELVGIPIVDRIAKEMWPRTVTGRPSSNDTDSGPLLYDPDVFVPSKITPEWFRRAERRSQRYACKAKHRHRYQRLAEEGEHLMKVNCDYNNNLYYQATDEALFDIVRACDWCTHVLVTNSDNTYHPRFLINMLYADSADIITSHFIEHGTRAVPSQWRLGHVDLGGVLFTKGVLETVGGFVASLPVYAGPQDSHDNDYWFFKRALETGARATILPRYLFSHN